jgi:hypothetical protein
MSAKLNFKTYLQNRFYNFLSHLSEGPKSYDCTKPLVLYILLSLCGSVTSHFPLTPGGQNLCQIVSKIETAVQNNLPKLFFSFINVL